MNGTGLFLQNELKSINFQNPPGFKPATGSGCCSVMMGVHAGYGYVKAGIAENHGQKCVQPIFLTPSQRYSHSPFLTADLRRKFLAVSLSEDGETFNTCYKIRCDADARPVYPGMHKAHGFCYPNAVVANDRLWIIFGTNKEDIELRSVALSDL